MSGVTNGGDIEISDLGGGAEETSPALPPPPPEPPEAADPPKVKSVLDAVVETLLERMDPP